MMQALIDALGESRSRRRRTLVDEQTLDRGEKWQPDVDRNDDD
jgi:hypothetical protein